jgi:hypothetical protein
MYDPRLTKTSGPTVSNGTSSYLITGTYIPTPITGSNTNYGSSIEFSQKLSGSVEGYELLKRSGDLLPCNAFSQFSESLSHSAGTYSEYLSGSPLPGDFYSYVETGFHRYSSAYSRPGIGYLGALANSIDYSYELSRAAASAYTSGSHDTLTFLSEVAKTRKLLFSVVTKFRDLPETAPRFIRQLKRHDARAYKKALNIWLEGRYGWRTLVYDLNDLNTAVRRLDRSRSRVKGGSQSSPSIPSSPLSVTLFSTSYADVIGTITDVISPSLRGYFLADYEPDRFKFNPFVTAWELIPYSFVFDWFIDVGTALEATTAVLLSKKYVASGGKLVSLNRTITTHAVPKPGFPGSVSVSCNYSSNYDATLVLRVPESVKLQPQLRVRLDGFKILDLISLVLTSWKI